MAQGSLARRTLGPIGIDVPVISIGCAPLANMPETFAFEVPEDEALATIRTGLDSPVNYLDTAAHYGDGESERRIGIVLRERGELPAGAFLQTKIGADGNNDYSGAMMRQRFERSLELLGMDRVELVFLHDPERTTFENTTAPGGPVEVLLDLKRQGLIGHVGVAGGPVDVMTRLVETGLFEAMITHNRYTLINRNAEPLIALASQRGMAVLNAAPYGSGMLAKGAGAYPRYAYAEASEAVLERARSVEAICARHGVPIAAAALQFSLRDERIHNTIVGMSKPGRIQQTLDLAALPISDECWSELMAQPFDTAEPE